MYYDIRKHQAYDEETATIDSVVRKEDASLDENLSFQANHVFFNQVYGLDALLLNGETGVFGSTAGFSSAEAIENMTLAKADDHDVLKTHYTIAETDDNEAQYAEITMMIVQDDSGRAKKVDFSKVTYPASALVDGRIPEKTETTGKEVWVADFRFGTLTEGDITSEIQPLYFTDYTPVFNGQTVDTDGNVHVSVSSSAVGFTVENPNPSTALTSFDPITIRSVEDVVADTGVAVKVSDSKVRFNKPGKTKVTFTSSTGVEKEVVVTVDYPPVKSVNVSTEDKTLAQGACDSFNVSVLPGDADQDVDVTLIEGSEYASLTLADGVYTVTINSDAEVGKTVRVRIQTRGYDDSGSSVDKYITYTIKAHEEVTGDITDILTGNDWVSEDGNSVLVFKKDGTGDMKAYDDSWIEYHFTFKYDARTGEIVLSDVVPDNESDKITSITYADNTITVVINDEFTVVFTAEQK